MRIEIESIQGIGEKRIEAGVQILAEGGDDSYFIRAMIEHMRQTDSREAADVQIVNLRGKDNLRLFLAGLSAMDGFENVQRMGIVRDADDSEKSAFHSVRSALRNAGLPIPKKIGQTAVKGNRLAITALILPGNGRTGALETLLCESFTADAVNKCVDEFFECVVRLNGAVEQPEKARVRAYIAAQTDPNVAAGGAAERGYWNFEHPAFEPIRRFLSLVVWGSEPQPPV